MENLKIKYFIKKFNINKKMYGKALFIGLILIFIIFLLHYSYMQWIFYDNSRKRVLGPLHDKLYKFTDDVQRLLDGKQIEYWAIAGTALGVGRHSGIIPWDDDVDLGIHESVENDVKKINWDSIDARIQNEGFGFKIISRKNSLVFIDFFIHRNNNGVYEFVDNESRSIWPKYTIMQNMIHPLQKRKFGNFEITTVNNLDGQLKTQFGEHYNSEGYIMLPHLYSSGLNQWLWKINPFIKFLHNGARVSILNKSNQS
jgi:lipopolysaccharide cholinephosphotransferase